MANGFIRIPVAAFGEKEQYHESLINISSLEYVCPMTDEMKRKARKTQDANPTAPPQSVVMLRGNRSLCSPLAIDRIQVFIKGAMYPIGENEIRMQKNEFGLYKKKIESVGSVKKCVKRYDISSELKTESVSTKKIMFLLGKDNVIVQGKDGKDIFCMTVPEFMNVKYSDIEYDSERESDIETTAYAPISFNGGSIDAIYEMTLNRQSRLGLTYLKMVLSGYLSASGNKIPSFGHTYESLRAAFKNGGHV